jgi:hypothetical protein
LKNKILEEKIFKENKEFDGIFENIAGCQNGILRIN